jgi:hypothetical protein
LDEIVVLFIDSGFAALSRESVTRTIDALKKDNCIKIQQKDRNVILLPGFLKLAIAS